MEVWITCILLMLAIAGIAVLAYGMRTRKWKNARWGIVALTIAALALAVYLGLTGIFVSSIL